MQKKLWNLTALKQFENILLSVEAPEIWGLFLFILQKNYAKINLEEKAAFLLICYLFIFTMG